MAEPTRAEPFRGFPEFCSNVLYCPKQFFTVVVPNSPVNCIRVVSYMLRKTLGWVDEVGDPIQEQHAFPFRQLEEAAGVGHSRLGEAIAIAQQSRFIRRVRSARVQRRGVRARSASFELCWDEGQYTDASEHFHGFYLQPTYLDRSGQTRLARKNIPNVFFDYVVRNESRAVIRVVGALLWYSIDWGKGGERRQPVRKSLRELVGLTRLDKSSIVRALDEAEAKGYVERRERGLFDLTDRQQSESTLYALRWTNEYTYSIDGRPVAMSQEAHSQNATQPARQDAPKMQHEFGAGTLPKCDTNSAPGRSQNATPNSPKTRHEQRSQNATKKTSKTDIYKTSIHSNNSNNATGPSAVAEDALINIGFDTKTAHNIAATNATDAILQQIALLPQRNPTKNSLGMLRRAIEERWAPPTDPKRPQVGSLIGRTFAANFYAGYHGNPDVPISDPSLADCTAAERFTSSLLTIWPDSALVASWGRQFGELVAHYHHRQHQGFPALRPAIQRYGDDFYSRLRRTRETQRKLALERYQSAHYNKYETLYFDYLQGELARNEIENTPLFQAFVAMEAREVGRSEVNGHTLNGSQPTERNPAKRLERFQQMILREEGHGVLDFWEWDRFHNPDPFNQSDVNIPNDTTDRAHA